MKTQPMIIMDRRQSQRYGALAEIENLTYGCCAGTESMARTARPQQRGECRVIEQAVKPNSRSQDYDLRNDQTMPSLQTAINETTSYRYRALQLRTPCLAGLIRHNGINVGLECQRKRTPHDSSRSWGVFR
jgi:hypothetical protein